ncbi:MAG TPA: hypothetical protein VJC39_05450 [Candidatus Nanoarchaeia archaeon]|nr:hypothetical protein [Candidatus Nanoarchaeia archaeon]
MNKLLKSKNLYGIGLGGEEIGMIMDYNSEMYTPHKQALSLMKCVGYMPYLIFIWGGTMLIWNYRVKNQLF